MIFNNFIFLGDDRLVREVNKGTPSDYLWYLGASAHLLGFFCRRHVRWSRYCQYLLQTIQGWEGKGLAGWGGGEVEHFYKKDKR